MDLLTLALILLAGVLVSAVLNQVLPKIALPLIQAAIGLIAALFIPAISTMQFDPDVFLVLFIAPLLFLEAKNANLKTLLKEIAPIVSLAVFLVVVTMLVIGWLLNLLIPAIALAAAVALGAALGPTDAVAVSSLSKTIRLPKWEHSIMEGEMLFNDASGIVGFQVALVVATTATFSMSEALGDFALEFFGGIIVGLAFGFVLRWIVNRIVKLGVQGSTFYVLFEVLSPFIIYLASSSMHVSGIIAVVVAGLFKIVDPRKFGANAPRLVIATNTMWSILSFALNGIVFILLGTQLPAIFSTTFGGQEYNPIFLIGVAAALTAALFLVRFLWAYGMELVHFRKVDRSTLAEFERNLSLPHRALITSLTGAKGAVTLSIMFTLPLDFPLRDLMICIASAVIVLSLLVSIFVVPLITPKKEQSSIKDEDITQLTISILRRVVKKLTDNIREAEEDANNAPTIEVVNTLNQEIRALSASGEISQEKKVQFFCDALVWEEEYLENMVERANKGDQSLSAVLDENVLAVILEGIDRRRSIYENQLSSDQRKKIKHARTLLKRAAELTKTAKSEEKAQRAACVAQIETEICLHVLQKIEEQVEKTGEQSAELLSVSVSYQSAYAKLTAKMQTGTGEASASREDVAEQAYDFAMLELNRRVREGNVSKERADDIKNNLLLLKTSSQMVE